MLNRACIFTEIKIHTCIEKIIQFVSQTYCTIIFQNCKYLPRNFEKNFITIVKTDIRNLNSTDLSIFM